MSVYRLGEIEPSKLYICEQGSLYFAMLDNGNRTENYVSIEELIKNLHRFDISIYSLHDKIDPLRYVRDHVEKNQEFQTRNNVQNYKRNQFTKNDWCR